MEKTSHLLCSNCIDKEMIEAKELIDLPCLPYEWYMEKNLFDKWHIYFCLECNRMYRKSKRFTYYLNILKSFITNSLK